MTDRELLESIALRMGVLENKMNGMESKMNSMESKMDTMQDDITTLKKTAYLVETDIAPKVQLLLENHTDLAKNVMVAKDIEERVGTLEFDTKLIKKILNAKAGA